MENVVHILQFTFLNPSPNRTSYQPTANLLTSATLTLAPFPQLGYFGANPR